jgi:hypothetical protein
MISSYQRSPGGDRDMGLEEREGGGEAFEAVRENGLAGKHPVLLRRVTPKAATVSRLPESTRDSASRTGRD